MLQMLLPQLHGAVNGNLPGYPGRCVCRFSENRLGTRDVHRNDRIVAVLFENDPKKKYKKKKMEADARQRRDHGRYEQTGGGADAGRITLSLRMVNF